MFTFLEPYIYTNSLNFVIGRLYAEPCLCNRLYIHVSKTMNLLYTYILFGPISLGPQPSLLINLFPNEWYRFVNNENNGWGSRVYDVSNLVHCQDLVVPDQVLTSIVT